MSSFIGFFTVFMKEPGEFITSSSKLAILYVLYIQAKKRHFGTKNTMGSCAERWWRRSLWSQRNFNAHSKWNLAEEHKKKMAACSKMSPRQTGNDSKSNPTWIYGYCDLMQSLDAAICLSDATHTQKTLGVNELKCRTHWEIVGV